MTMQNYILGYSRDVEKATDISRHVRSYAGTLTSSTGGKCSKQRQYVIQCAEELCDGTQLTMRPDGNISVKRITAKEPKQQTAGVGDVLTGLSLRTLTPRESFRLMGLTESEIDTLQSSGISRCQQYKLAGNSIVVDVLEEIFRKLFIDTANDDQQLTIFDNL